MSHRHIEHYTPKDFPPFLHTHSCTTHTHTRAHTRISAPSTKTGRGKWCHFIKGKQEEITYMLNCELAGGAENKVQWTEQKHIDNSKRNNYYAFSYEILRNKFALAFAYSTVREKKKAVSREGEETAECRRLHFVAHHFPKALKRVGDAGWHRSQKK